MMPNPATLRYAPPPVKMRLLATFTLSIYPYEFLKTHSFYTRRDLQFDTSFMSHNAAESKTIDKPTVCRQHISKSCGELSVTDVECIPAHRLLPLTNSQKEKIAKFRGLDLTRSLNCCLTFFGLTFELDERFVFCETVRRGRKAEGGHFLQHLLCALANGLNVGNAIRV